MQAFARKAFGNIEKSLVDPLVGIKPIMFNFLVMNEDFYTLGMKDSSFSGLSIMFVYGYLTYHLGSLFLAWIGIVLILFSFPLTVLVTEGIFRVTFFCQLHTLVIFIVLGIAADDIFVFIDAWRQSEKITHFAGDKKKRMAYSWRRAVRAIAVTSSTTSVAFFANAFSPIMPIKSFGIFAGVIVPMNYIVIVLLFPAATIIYEERIHGKCSFYCGKVFKCCSSDSDKVEALNPDDESAQYSKVEYFFRTKWNDFVFKWKTQIVAFVFIWTVVCSVFAFQIGPLTKAEEFVAPDHPLMLPQNLMLNNFTKTTDANADVFYYWGVKDINRKGDSMWVPDFIGEVILDDQFSISCKECQIIFKDFCPDLIADKFIVKNSANCWFTDFYAYVKKQDLDLPLEEDEFNKVLFKWIDNTREGKMAKMQKKVGIIKDKVVFVEFNAKSKADFTDPAYLKKPEMDLF